MDLWENEVYRFKTIGQLKVGQRLSFRGFFSFFSISLLSVLFHLSVISGHQSVFAQGRSAPQTGHLWNDLAWVSQNWLRGTLSYTSILGILWQNPMLANGLSHLCCPWRVSPHWSVNGPESFTTTWRLFKQSATTWRGTQPTELCSPRWLNCEWSWHRSHLKVQCVGFRV